MSEIQNEFNADGRKLYEQTLELLEWAKCKCGIDFCMDGRRFGNYEVYYRTPENSSFEIDIHKDQGLRVATIRKRKDFAEDIIVNCIGKYKDLSLIHIFAFSEISEGYHDELYGYLKEQGWLNEYKQGKATVSYKRLNTDGTTQEQQICMTEYIRHQIHHPENTYNARFNDSQLRRSIEDLSLIHI